MQPVQTAHLELPEFGMDYIRFGSGEKDLVLIPGMSDGFRTVRDSALSFAVTYGPLACDFTVWVFSRRDRLPEGMTTRAMAEDQNLAMEALGLSRAAVVGVSLGGMIAQWLAIDHPERVRKLVLTVTASRINPTGLAVITRWIELAKRGDYQGIMLDTAERSYSEKHRQKAMRIYERLGDTGKPESFDRFLIQAASCLSHYTYDDLHRITCPTLVIGGTDDRIIPPAGSRNIAARIPNSELRRF